MYQHVIFDLDGTLIDSRADLSAAVNHVLRELQRSELPPDVVVSYIGEGARRLVQRALGNPDDAALDRALAIFLAYYGRHLLDATQLYPGIRAMLAGLHEARVILSVLTNKPTGMSRAILVGLGIDDLFAAVVGGDALPTRKPDPSGVSELIRRTATAAERVLLVGDSSIDWRTARAAGVAFCGVSWGLRPQELRAAGAHLVDSPAMLLDLITAVPHS